MDLGERKVISRKKAQKRAKMIHCFVTYVPFVATPDLCFFVAMR